MWLKYRIVYTRCLSSAHFWKTALLPENVMLCQTKQIKHVVTGIYMVDWYYQLHQCLCKKISKPLRRQIVRLSQDATYSCDS